jgi:large subunit ribosomal protein L13
MSSKFEPTIIFDADGAVMGRLASQVAKQLQFGNQIAIVNSEKAVISGSPAWIKGEFFHRRERGDKHKGPFYPRYPDRMLKRSIAGMLPRKKPRGRGWLSNLRCFIGVPPELTGKPTQPAIKSVSSLHCKYMTLQELCRLMGAKI